MTVAGIDFNTKTVDVVLLDDDTNRATAHPFPISDPRGSFYAARSVRRALPLRGWWEDNGVWLIGIEKPMGVSFKASAPLMRIQGAVLACLPDGLTVVELPPAEWKTAIGTRANASKTDVFRRVSEIAPLNVVDRFSLDAIDAYAIAWAIRALNEQGIREAEEAAA